MNYADAKILPAVIQWIASRLQVTPCTATCDGCQRYNPKGHTCSLLEDAIDDLTDRGVI